MIVQVTTDNTIDGNAELEQRVRLDIESGLARFTDRITRVEVHLSDEMAGRSDGNDKRCMLEARPTGSAPVAVVESAGSVEEALSGAVRKLRSLLDSRFGRMDARKGGDSIRHLDVDEGPL